MAARARMVLCGFAVVPLAVGFWLGVRAETPKSPPPRVTAGFTLQDTAGKAISLDSFKDKKALVVIFLGTQCPLNNQYVARLGELHKEFADKGVQFLGINSNVQDTANRIAAHAKKHEIAFPVLRDEENKVADLFGAKRTPEAFLLDEKRVVRYQGRIDDQYGIDVQRPQPTRRDLAEAINEVLAGKAVTVASTTAPGCLIGRAAKAKEDGEITFTKHIVPILQNKCQECHRSGQIGPMALQDYDDVTAWAGMIREVVKDGRMPPWHADPRHGKWINDLSLSQKERETLLTWIESGVTRGDDNDLPAKRAFPEGWKIGQPDVVLRMPVEFDVPAKMPKGGVPYKHYTIETGFDEDKWIERAEAKPGAPEVVHHMLAFVVPPGKRFFPGNPDTPVICGMAPGDTPMILNPGMARLIPKGAKIVFQMHYTPNGKAQKDRSQIGLIFAKQPPDKVVVCHPVFNAFFKIPKGAQNHEVTASYTFKKDGYLYGFMPHMHLRGKDFLFRADYPDRRQEVLLSVPRFNFNWQSVYRPVEPIPMPKGSKLVAIAHFDNSKSNPNNPNPEEDVYWGDQTWQEMMIGWVDFAYDRKEK